MEKEHLKLRKNQFKKTNLKGFTLLESLVALMMLSLIFLLFFSVLENSKAIIKQLETSEEKAWHIFLIQLENELEGCFIEEVYSNKIGLKKKQTKHLVWIENKLGKIVKVENGGYQPMLIKVKEASFDKKMASVEMTVLFENNQKFVGRWSLIKENWDEQTL